MEALNDRQENAMRLSKIILLLLLSAVIGLLMAFPLNKIKISNPIDYSFSSNGALYLLDQQKDGTHLLHFSEGGTLQQDTLLQMQSQDEEITYKALELDEKNNIYLLTENSKYVSIGLNEEKRMITEEAVRMYDEELHPLRTAIEVEQQGDEEKSCLRKLYLRGQTVYAVYQKDLQVEIYAVKAMINGASKKLATFTAVAPVNKDETEHWILDVVCTAGGSALYATADGKLYQVVQGQSEEVSQAIGGRGVVTGFFLNETGDICFTESLSGTLYSFDLKTSTAKKLFTINSPINDEKKIKFEDVSNVKMDVNGLYRAQTSNPDESCWVGFGNKQTSISNLTGAIFPQFILHWCIASVICAAILMLIYAYRCLFRGRLLLVYRILLLYLPACVVGGILFAVGLSILSMIPVYESVEETLRNEANIMLEQLEHMNVKEVDLLEDYGTDSYIQLRNAFCEVASTVGRSAGRRDNINLYTSHNQRLFLALSQDVKQVFQPLSTMAGRQALERYQTTLTSPFSDPEGNRVFEIEKSIGTDIKLLTTVAMGNNVGLLEISTDGTEYITAVFLRNLTVIGAAVLLFMILLLLYFLFVLRRSFQPLVGLKETANKIAEGKWTTKIQIGTKDEFGDIGTAFNMMTEKLNQYVSNLVVLNRAYIKFVPRELFQMIGKTKITEIALKDRNIDVMSILYVRFQIQNDENKQLSEMAHFDMMNDSFDKLFSIIRKNDGVIDQFDGVGMLCLFPNSVKGAVMASIQFREYFQEQKDNGQIKIVVSTGKTLIGVAGNASRNTIIAVSDEITRCYKISERMDEVGLQHVITQDTFDALGEQINSLRYRFAGEMKSPGDEKRKLYEALDGLPFFEKKLYLTTRDCFEKGVTAYIEGDLKKARDYFAEVICINKNDAAAMHYLLLCDENSRKNHKSWEGVLL